MIIPFISSCSYTFYSAACDYPLPGALKKLSVLNPALNETSGIVAIDSLYYTFNDSGAEAEIFSFSEHSSLIQKTIIANSTNVDWESIAFDGDYFYVADVGNNFGTRDTLTIYKIPSDGIKNRDPIAFSSEQITFSYNEEVFKSSRGWYSHDCEAIFSYGDSLYLISKDWVGKSARIYTLPKEPGHYNIEHRNAYPVDALITGSDVNPGTREVALVGYRNYVPVLIVYSFDKDPSSIKCGGKVRKYPLHIGTQVEAVCFDENGRIMITAEKQLYKQALYTTY
jgi:hypothetical protein